MECYDDEAEVAPSYCTQAWRDCCKAAGGIGPVSNGVADLPVNGDGSEACVCDLGCGERYAIDHHLRVSWGASRFKSCLLSKEKNGEPLTYQEAVCGPPAAQAVARP